MYIRDHPLLRENKSTFEKWTYFTIKNIRDTYTLLKLPLFSYSGSALSIHFFSKMGKVDFLSVV